MGDVPDHRRLHEAGLDAVPVQVLLGQGEMIMMGYLARAFSSSKERRPSSRVPSTAVSQARTRSCRRFVFDVLARRRVLSSSWRAAQSAVLATGDGALGLGSDAVGGRPVQGWRRG